jgi:hypothetical protein
MNILAHIQKKDPFMETPMLFTAIEETETMALWDLEMRQSFRGGTTVK